MTNLPQIANWLARNAESLILGSLVAALIVLVMLGLRILGHQILKSDPHCMTWKGVIARVLAKTTLFFMVATALDVVARFADMPAKPERIFYIIFTIAAAFQAAIWVRELILGVIHRNVGEEPGGTALGNATAVIRVLVSVLLFGLAIVVILSNLGVNVTALVAGLGVGGIAIGLAAQGIFADLFAALSILFDRPFRRGDTIRYDTTTGTVERIGLKTTRLRASTGEQVIMGNTKLLEREIHNLAEANRRRVSVPFGLALKTAPELLAKVEPAASDAVKGVNGTKLVRCAIVGIGASSLDHELVYDDDSIDADINAARKAAILATLLRNFAAEGLLLATPAQTGFAALPDGTLVPPYPGAALP